MTEELATIQAKASVFRQLLVESALNESGGDPPWIHSDVYLRVNEDSVDVLVQAGGGSVNTFCTYEADEFEDLEGSATAIIEVGPTLDRLAVAADDGRMSFTFHGPDEDSQAERLVADGALEMSVTLPASEKALDKVPEDLPDRWDDDNRFLSPSGNPHQTIVDTTVEQVQKVIEAVGLDDSSEYFPITVEDGDFTMNVGDDLEYLRGDLVASNVDGPDLQNYYGPGFEAAFADTLSGDVQLQTTPGEDGGHPMAIVQDSTTRTVRHVLVEVNPA